MSSSTQLVVGNKDSLANVVVPLSFIFFLAGYAPCYLHYFYMILPFLQLDFSCIRDAY
jgi:hypothetical protein